MVAASLKDIGAARKSIYTWFPAGIGPRPGVDTDSRPEIWSKPSDFKAAQDKFAAQADALQKLANNPTALAAQARALGGTCKSCHESFRVAHD